MSNTFKRSRTTDGGRGTTAKTAVAVAPPTPKGLVFLICVGLAVLVTIPYAQVGTHEFTICDDNDYIFENPQVRQGLTWQGIQWAFEPHAGNWHPLTWMSHMLDWQLFSDSSSVDPNKGAGFHHVENVLLHMMAAIVLFLALRKMTDTIWPSAIVAALFAIHPLRVESVAWAAERKDVLGALFWTLTMLAYAWYAERPKKKIDVDLAIIVGALRYLLVIALYGLGLASKSMLVTLPCALFLLDLWPMKRWALLNRDNPAQCRFPPRPFWWLFAEKLPLFLMAFAASHEAIVSQDLAVALNTAEGLPLNYRINNALVCYVAYLGKTIWPSHMAIFYPHDAMLPGHSVFVPKDPSVHLSTIEMFWQIFKQQLTFKPPHGPNELLLPFLAGCLLLAITLGVVLAYRSRPYLAIGWFWFVGTLIPVIGLVQVGTQSMADRYSYIPSIGLYFAVVWGLVEVARRWPETRLAFAIVVPALLLGLTVITGIQVSTWKNSYTLFDHAARVVPRNYFAFNHLGKAHDTDGQREMTLARLSEAQGKHNDATAHEKTAWKHFHAARDEFEKSIAIKPDYDFGNNNLAVCYARENRYAEAEVLLRKALQVNGRYADAYNNMGVVCSNQKRYAEAVKYHQAGMQIRPDRSSDHCNLGRAYEQLADTQRTSEPGACMENWKLAAEQYFIALQIDPSYENNRALLCALGVLHNLQQASRDPWAAEFSKNIVERWLGYHSSGNDRLQAFFLLAEIYARLGELDSAEQCMRKVLEIDPTNTVGQQNLKIILEQKAKAASKKG
jgi:protein O-mannosyl-transferase